MTSPRLKSNESNKTHDQSGSGDRTDFSNAGLNRDIVYSPESELRRGWSLFRETARGFIKGRELAWRLLQRNLRGMYRQTLLGVVWAFLPPLANALIWIFLYAQNVVGFGDAIAVPYPLYVLTGMIIWQSFVEAIQMPLNVIRQNRSMITKLNFPREALLVVGWGELLLNLAIRAIILLPLLFVYRADVSWVGLMFPVAVGFLIILGTAIGLCIMPIGVLYQDVERLLLIGLPLWMVITPIIYSVKAAVPAWLHWINPAAGLLIVGRDSLLQGSLEHWALACGYAALSLPLLFVGLVVYRVSLPILIERMPA
jgi:homopolymeric O-antigen transport system permease protein